eukprot:scaffold267343_cov17-Tisochrysis_lutea.AAC.1
MAQMPITIRDCGSTKCSGACEQSSVACKEEQGRSWALDFALKEHGTCELLFSASGCSRAETLIPVCVEHPLSSSYRTMFRGLVQRPICKAGSWTALIIAEACCLSTWSPTTVSGPSLQKTIDTGLNSVRKGSKAKSGDMCTPHAGIAALPMIMNKSTEALSLCYRGAHVIRWMRNHVRSGCSGSG